MNRRVATTFAFVCCLVAAFIMGPALPHHHEGGAAEPDSHCPACVWMIACATDVPVVVVVFFSPILVLAIAAASPVLWTAAFVSSTSARAPPAIPA